VFLFTVFGFAVPVEVFYSRIEAMLHSEHHRLVPHR
jgi:hypothetical protein